MMRRNNLTAQNHQEILQTQPLAENFIRYTGVDTPSESRTKYKRGIEYN